MDPIYLMKVFIAVGEEESLAAASRRLNLSSVAVTRAVSALEAQLGNKLLLRMTRNVRLTDAGRRYLEGLKGILAKLAEADETAAGINSDRRRRLTVTASPLFGRNLVIPCIVEYMHRFPDVDVSAHFADRIVNLVDEKMDVAVRIGRLPDSGLKSVAVGWVRRLLCASPAYLDMHGSPEHPPDLREHMIIATSAMSPRVDVKSGWHDGPANSRLRPRLTVTSHDAAIEAALAGLGITRLLSCQAAPLLANGSLKIVLVGHEAAPLPVQVLHREGKYGSSKVRDFIDSLVARLRADSSLN
jgi:DNA-binding transcriptional LysR family regulator